MVGAPRVDRSPEGRAAVAPLPAVPPSLAPPFAHGTHSSVPVLPAVDPLVRFRGFLPVLRGDLGPGSDRWARTVPSSLVVDGSCPTCPRRRGRYCTQNRRRNACGSALANWGVDSYRWPPLQPIIRAACTGPGRDCPAGVQDERKGRGGSVKAQQHAGKYPRPDGQRRPSR